MWVVRTLEASDATDWTGRRGPPRPGGLDRLRHV